MFNENFYKRLITSIILIGLITILLLYYGIQFIHILITMLLFLCVFEWMFLVYGSNIIINNKILFLVIGMLYIFTSYFMFWIISMSIVQHSVYMLFIIFLLVWISDSTGYFVGKIFKGRKLCPEISPGKTWSGALGNIFFTTFLGGILLSMNRVHELFNINIILSGWNNFFMNTDFFLIAGVISIIGQLGDLIQSKAKRFLFVKDSGVILPGHGGVLDRFDSFLLIIFFIFCIEILGYIII